jgi:hypothetical protein
MSAAFFGAFQPTHLQITQWMTLGVQDKPLPALLTPRLKESLLFHAATLDARYEAETGAKPQGVQIILADNQPCKIPFVLIRAYARLYRRQPDSQ